MPGFLIIFCQVLDLDFCLQLAVHHLIFMPFKSNGQLTLMWQQTRVWRQALLPINPLKEATESRNIGLMEIPANDTLYNDGDKFILVRSHYVAVNVIRFDQMSTDYKVIM